MKLSIHLPYVQLHSLCVASVTEKQCGQFPGTSCNTTKCMQTCLAAAMLHKRHSGYVWPNPREGF